MSEYGEDIHKGQSERHSGLAFPRRLRYQTAMTNESIDQLARRLAESVPQGLKAARDDLEQNFRSVLRSGVARLDLVTREEFDVQQAVLARTREMLERFEQRLASLEAELPAKKTRKKAARKPASKAKDE